MFDLKPYLLLLWGKRRFLFGNMAFAVLASAVFAFFIARMEYSSQAVFLPPFGPSGSLMSMVRSNPVLGMLSLGDEPGDNIEAVFDSKILKRKIIEKFNLYDNYKLKKSVNKFELAVKKMQKHVMLAIAVKGKGIGMSKTVSYGIKCFHTSPDTALQMAEFVFACLDSAVIDISINKARRNREFIEAQFTASQMKLDSLQNAFKVFQVTYKAFDISEQMKLTLKTYSEIKSAAVVNDIKLQMLKWKFNGNSPEISEAMNAKKVYERQLAEFEKNNEYAVLPSLNMSSELLPKYTDIYRALEVQSQINLMLTGELEQARLQEARDVSPLILIDPPYKAEYKSRPKRIPMVAAISFGYMFFLVFIIIAQRLFSEFKMSFIASKPEN